MSRYEKIDGKDQKHMKLANANFEATIENRSLKLKKPGLPVATINAIVATVLSVKSNKLNI